MEIVPPVYKELKMPNGCYALSCWENHTVVDGGGYWYILDGAGKHVVSIMKSQLTSVKLA